MSVETITAFAKRFGLSRATLLYYDRIGLLPPAGLNPSGYRLYGEREEARMRRIDTYRRAGLPLQAIRAVLDGTANDTLDQALEQRLATLNDEIAALRAQQRLVLELLKREGEQTHSHTVTVAQWVAMLEEAGVDEQGRIRWHRAFERDAPDAHQEFLQGLGLEAEQVTAIRQRSRIPNGT